jgi:hypothetical protein
VDQPATILTILNDHLTNYINKAGLGVVATALYTITLQQPKEPRVILFSTTTLHIGYIKYRWYSDDILSIFTLFGEHQFGDTRCILDMGEDTKYNLADPSGDLSVWVLETIGKWADTF